MAWWAGDQGASRRMEMEEVKPADYATVAVCYGRVKSSPDDEHVLCSLRMKADPLKQQRAAII